MSDFNDEAPIFTKSTYIASASESDPIGRSVITVSAADRDLAYRGRVSYKIVDGDIGGNIFPSLYLIAIYTKY